jgi:hypothetical protein
MHAAITRRRKNITVVDKKMNMRVGGDVDVDW